MSGGESPSDRSELHDLVASFAESVNEMQPTGLRGLFAEDAEFEIRGWATLHGPDEIVGFLTGVLGHWTMIMQMVGSGRVALDGDRAAGTWYITEYGLYRDGNETFLGGRYRDAYVRTPAGWRFSRRQFRGRWRRAAPGDIMQVWPPGPKAGQ